MPSPVGYPNASSIDFLLLFFLPGPLTNQPSHCPLSMWPYYNLRPLLFSHKVDGQLYYPKFWPLEWFSLTMSFSTSPEWAFQSNFSLYVPTERVHPWFNFDLSPPLSAVHKGVPNMAILVSLGKRLVPEWWITWVFKPGLPASELHLWLLVLFFFDPNCTTSFLQWITAGFGQLYDVVSFPQLCSWWELLITWWLTVPRSGLVITRVVAQWEVFFRKLIIILWHRWHGLTT